MAELIEEEIEVDSESLPGARKAFDKIFKELKRDWPQITHQIGGSVIKMEKMYDGEHIILTCDADASVSTLS